MPTILLHNERTVYVTQNPVSVLDMNQIFQVVFSLPTISISLILHLSLQ